MRKLITTTVVFEFIKSGITAFLCKKILRVNKLKKVIAIITNTE